MSISLEKIGFVQALYFPHCHMYKYGSHNRCEQLAYSCSVNVKVRPQMKWNRWIVLLLLYIITVTYCEQMTAENYLKNFYIEEHTQIFGYLVTTEWIGFDNYCVRFLHYICWSSLLHTFCKHDVLVSYSVVIGNQTCLLMINIFLLVMPSSIAFTMLWSMSVCLSRGAFRLMVTLGTLLGNSILSGSWTCWSA